MVTEVQLGEHPENTLRSVEHAVSIGVDVVEIDVRATRDRVIIVLQDLDFKRVSGFPRGNYL